MKGDRNAFGEDEATDTPGRLEELNMACHDWGVSSRKYRAGGVVNNVEFKKSTTAGCDKGKEPS